MAVPVLMPQRGQFVKSCIISEWLKKPGDKIKKGDILFTYETDKAVFPESADCDGTLLTVFYQEGEDIPCRQIIAVIGEPEEDYSEYIPQNEIDIESKNKAETKDIISREETKEIRGISEELTIKNTTGAASPRARVLAEKMGIDISAIPEGSGPGGRIMEEDVRKAAADPGFRIDDFEFEKNENRNYSYTYKGRESGTVNMFNFFINVDGESMNSEKIVTLLTQVLRNLGKEI